MQYLCLYWKWWLLRSSSSSWPHRTALKAVSHSSIRTVSHTDLLQSSRYRNNADMKLLLPAAWVLKTARGIVKVRGVEDVLCLGFALYVTL